LFTCTSMRPMVIRLSAPARGICVGGNTASFCGVGAMGVTPRAGSGIATASGTGRRGSVGCAAECSGVGSSAAVSTGCGGRAGPESALGEAGAALANGTGWFTATLGSLAREGGLGEATCSGEAGAVSSMAPHGPGSTGAGAVAGLGSGAADASAAATTGGCIGRAASVESRPEEDRAGGVVATGGASAG